MSLLQHILALAARVLLSVVFLWGGAMQIVFFWHDTLSQLQDKGLPYPVTLLALAVAAQLIGGLSLLLGLQARWGAVILILFLVGATGLMHDFWIHDPASPEYLMQAIQFLRNLGLLGGMCLILAFGPGGFAADTFLRKRPAA